LADVVAKSSYNNDFFGGTLSNFFISKEISDELKQEVQNLLLTARPILTLYRKLQQMAARLNLHRVMFRKTLLL
jgi:hypothetical protein